MVSVSGLLARPRHYLGERQVLAGRRRGSRCGGAGKGYEVACEERVRLEYEARDYLELAGRRGWQESWQAAGPGQVDR